MTDDRRPNDPHDDDAQRFWERGFGKRLDGLIPEMLKRTIAGSLGSLIMTEEGLREVLKDLRLPKEMMQFILQQADHTKREFMRVVAREVREFLDSSDLRDELLSLLSQVTFEVNTTVRLVPDPKNKDLQPDVTTNRVRVVRRRDREDERPDDVVWDDGPLSDASQDD